MVTRENVRALIGSYSPEGFVAVIKAACAPATFVAVANGTTLTLGEALPKVRILGVVRDLPGEGGLAAPLLVADVPLGNKPLTERSSRIAQFKVARKTLEQVCVNPPVPVNGIIVQGVFAFHGNDGAFRISLVTAKAENGKLVWSQVKRQSFYVEKDPERNATFIQRMTMNWSSLAAIKEAFSVEKLTKEFYTQLFKWYQLACDDKRVEYPNDIATDKDNRDDKNRKHLLRLITRLMFVWFLKQKGLVPDELFDEDALKGILKNFNPTGKKQHQYYRAILQNLFFATLNSEIGERGFAETPTPNRKGEKATTKHHGVKTKYRYADEFALSRKEVVDLFRKVPFLNGGLFECLDQEGAGGKVMYYDGFSLQECHRDRGTLTWAHVPNDLFFDEEYGIIPLLKRYNFTVEENTPGDEDVALDPELLGKVFENLLGAYNPETEEVVRKSTGSFYTPREIVNYMVDESLIAYLEGKVENGSRGARALPANSGRAVASRPPSAVRALVKDGVCPADAGLRRTLIVAIEGAKILDPACGSGAFPMGALLKMAELLRILKGLKEGANLYALKLQLIENCIFGVDIQEIAVQISKLRFFISLVCEQKPDWDAPNYGINTLPNLETKFVAANSLIGLKRTDKKQCNSIDDADQSCQQLDLLFDSGDIERIKQALWDVRHKHFLAKTRKEKNKLRKEDKELRTKLAKRGKELGYSDDATRLMALWDPYNQNVHADFFDPAWMFNVKDGFDVVIGNPPYKILSKNNTDKDYLKLLLQRYSTIKNSSSKNLYLPFIECGLCSFVRRCGVLSFIVPEGLFATKSYADCKAMLYDRGAVEQVIYFSSFVFENAVTGNLIFLYRDAGNATTVNYCFDPEFNLHLKEKGPEDLLNKIEKDAVSLGKIAESFKGMVVKDRDSVVCNDRTRQCNDVFLLGKDIRPWVVTPCRYTSFRRLQIIGGTKRKEQHDHVPRILVRRTGDVLLGALLSSPALTESTLYSIWSISNKISDKIILALLNSQLLRFYCKHRCITNQQGYPQILLGNLLSLPIRTPTAGLFERLVDKILAAKKKDHDADTTEWEREIDELVYDLYGLTKEERKIVEGGRARSPSAPQSGNNEDALGGDCGHAGRVTLPSGGQGLTALPNGAPALPRKRTKVSKFEEEF